jgi:formylmethanofuran dehydrogenase subunit B
MILYQNVICPFCNCLCHDQAVEVEDNVIKDVKTSCLLAQEKYRALERKKLEPMINGGIVSYALAVQKTAQHLAAAQHALLCGLAETDWETQAKAISLAEYLGGSVDVNSIWPDYGMPSLSFMPFFPTCTLGGVKNRADLLLFWHSNPLVSHPRLLNLLDASQAGGKKKKKLIVVADQATSISDSADLFILLDKNASFNALTFLRAELRNKGRTASGLTGETEAKLMELSKLLSNADLGVLFLTETEWYRQGMARHFVNLWQELNKIIAFHILPLPTALNLLGAEAVMTWQTGYPGAVNFSAGYPRYGPREYTATVLVENKESDVVLTFESSCQGLRCYTLNGETEIYIPSAQLGIDAEGIVFRFDQIPFSLLKLVDSHYLPQHLILQQISEAIRRC